VVAAKRAWLLSATDGWQARQAEPCRCGACGLVPAYAGTIF